MTALKRETAAEVVRDMIGTGRSTRVPRAVRLGAGQENRVRHAHVQEGSGTLLADGTLTRGVSPTARLRVAQRGGAAPVTRTRSG